MTLQEAKAILKNYKLPMSSEELKNYKKAFDLVTKSILKNPTVED